MAACKRPQRGPPPLFCRKKYQSEVPIIACPGSTVPANPPGIPAIGWRGKSQSSTPGRYPVSSSPLAMISVSPTTINWIGLGSRIVEFPRKPAEDALVERSGRTAVIPVSSLMIVGRKRTAPVTELRSKATRIEPTVGARRNRTIAGWASVPLEAEIWTSGVRGVAPIGKGTAAEETTVSEIDDAVVSAPTGSWSWKPSSGSPGRVTVIVPPPVPTV